MFAFVDQVELILFSMLIFLYFVDMILEERNEGRMFVNIVLLEVRERRFE